MSSCKHGSSLAFESISKCDENDLQCTLMSDITETEGFVDDGLTITARNSTGSLCSKVSSCESSREVGKGGEFWVNESSESSIVESSKIVSKHEDPFVGAGFDLNDEIDIDNVAPMAIRVVAKSGVCIGKPTLPLKFRGAMEWKGLAETSAFRPTILSKVRFSGIDLNVTALEDGSPSTLRGKSLGFDLNYPYGATDESFQPKPPLLNLDTSGSKTRTEYKYKSSLPHWLSRTQGNQDFVLGDHHRLSSTQHVVNNAHILMRRVASLQHTLPFMMPPLHDPIHFVSGSIPHMGHMEMWNRPSMKRKEPEDGLGRYKLGYG